MEENAGIKELDVLDIQWYLDHHFAKTKHRQKIVEDINLKPGDVVLDLGCGAGLWSSMFAEKVQPNGRVIGVDIDSRWIDYAVQNLENNSLKNSIEYRLDDLNNLSFEDETFDFVFISGCSSYLPDIHPILEKQKRVIKKGGRLADRSWDDGLFIAHPITSYFTGKIMLAVAQAFEERTPDNYFDNYFGRKSYGIFQEVGLKDISTTSYAVQLLSPLSLEEQRYLIGNAKLYGEIAAPYISEAELKQWKAYFDPQDEEYILNRHDFYFCMLEVLTIGTI